MTSSKNLTLNGLTLPHSLFLVLSLAMMGVSIYLTNHFFQAHFPSGFHDAGLCNINDFWSCDHSSLSNLGSILNVPTAFFGIIIGAMGVMGAIFPSLAMERTTKFFILLNAVGCVLLLIYSLVALGGLCPFCTLYYVLSWIAAFIFIKNSDVKPIPDIKPAIAWGVIVLIGGFFFAQHYGKKQAIKASLSSQYVDRFYELRAGVDPQVDTEFKLSNNDLAFKDAPIRISVFSDFQCPYCKFGSEAIEFAIKGIEDKVSVQYFFFPLDKACNHNVTGSFHPYACRAAYLAACDTTKFKSVHDEIFRRQDSLSNEVLEEIQKNHGLSGCFENEAAKAKVLDAISVADTFKVNSTPVMVINGRKITSALEGVHLRSILQGILMREGK